jgi:type IV secretory pathway VirB10-like protein
MLEKEAPQATEEPIEEPIEEPTEEVTEEALDSGKLDDRKHRLARRAARADKKEEASAVEEPQPLTAEQFSTALSTLTTRAKQAGLRPIQMMASSYIAQGLSMIDGLLDAFDENGQKKKKKDQ